MQLFALFHRKSIEIFSEHYRQSQTDGAGRSLPIQAQGFKDFESPQQACSLLKVFKVGQLLLVLECLAMAGLLERLNVGVCVSLVLTEHPIAQALKLVNEAVG